MALHTSDIMLAVKWAQAAFSRQGVIKAAGCQVAAGVRVLDNCIACSQFSPRVPCALTG